MEIEVRRLFLTDRFSAGEIYVDGEFEAFSLERRVPVDGIKVTGETAIPVGDYRIELRESQHFKRLMPFLTHVPGFAGVMLHEGNKPSASRGCILVGAEINYDEGIIPEHESRPGFEQLFAKIRAAFQDEETVMVIVTETHVVQDTRERVALH